MTVEEMNERKRILGYSYEQISHLSGVPDSTVRKILGGVTRRPRYATLTALAQVLREPTPADIYGAVKKQGQYTLDDYLALPPERRAELIDGALYDMSIPTVYHQLIVGQLYAMFLFFTRGKSDRGMPFVSPVEVLLDHDNRTVVQPDLFILCDWDKYTPDRIIGAPDYVAEVISKPTHHRDVFIKLSCYKSAGVREYWIIDPDKKSVMVWDFDNDDRAAVYDFRSRIPVGIYGGELIIDFAEIDDHLSQWMSPVPGRGSEEPFSE